MQPQNTQKLVPRRFDRIIKKVNNEILFSAEELCSQKNYDEAVSYIIIKFIKLLNFFSKQF